MQTENVELYIDNMMAGLDCITRSQTQRLVKRELGHHVYCYINANLFST